MKKTFSPGTHGFSLVELLVVIAVIAIIAAIAIPNIANITSQASVAKNQRNAQNLASVAASARAAGYTNAWANKAEATAALVGNNGVGVSVGSGNNIMNFGVSGLSSADVTAAETYLSFTNSAGGTLIYSPTNTATATP